MRLFDSFPFSPKQNLNRHFATHASITRRERYRGMAWLIRYGIAAQAMETLVSGAFLVALALQLGASNLMIGILVAIPQVAALMQLPGIWLVEKMRNRKAIIVLSGMVSRPGILLIAIAPFLPDPKWSLGFLITGLSIRYAFGCLLNSAWMSLARDIVPPPVMGRYYAQRFIWITITSAVITLSAAGLIDLWKHFFVEKYIYGLMALVSFLFGLMSVYCIHPVPEPQMTAQDKKEIKAFHHSLLEPFQDRNFSRLITFLFSWNFAANLALPFFNVHMLQTLKLSITSVMALTILNQMVQVATLGIWGRISDRFNNKMVMAFCCPIMIAAIFAWTFIDDIPAGGGQITLLAVLFSIMGIATAGITLAANNINLKLAPDGEATAYITATLVMNALATGLAPIIGGSLADFFAARTLTLSLTWVSPVREKAFNALTITHWDFFFSTAVILGLLALRQLRYVKERGQISERPVYAEILSEFARSFAPFATPSGLIGAMLQPWRRLRRKKRKGR